MPLLMSKRVTSFRGYMLLHDVEESDLIPGLHAAVWCRGLKESDLIPGQHAAVWCRGEWPHSGATCRCIMSRLRGEWPHSGATCRCMMSKRVTSFRGYMPLHDVEEIDLIPGLHAAVWCRGLEENDLIPGQHATVWCRGEWPYSGATCRCMMSRRVISFRGYMPLYDVEA